MPRLVKICIVLFVFFLGLIFHLRNDQPVLLDYYLNTVEVSFSLVFVLTLITGVVLGALVSLPMRIKTLRENAQLKKQLTTSEKEINALRTIPIKDNL